jgi:hypothetical protein
MWEDIKNDFRNFFIWGPVVVIFAVLATMCAEDRKSQEGLNQCVKFCKVFDTEPHIYNDDQDDLTPSCTCYSNKNK